MGVWGPGNFEGDDPREFLADMVARWERIIECSLAGEPTEEVAESRFAPGFETLDGAILPMVEILIAVAETLPCDHLPGPGKVARWSAEALKIHDDEIDLFDPDEDYKRERRSVIVETFQRLAKVVEGRDDS